MPDSTNIVRVDPVSPDRDIIRTAGKLLEKDGLVIFPATCMYGVAANAFSHTAVKKVFDLKQRSKKKAILILVPGQENIPDFAASVPDTAKILAAAFWPGKLTLVCHAKKNLSDLLTAGTGKIGIRQPGHPVTLELIKNTGFPLTGTSANLSGKDNCITTDQLPQRIIEQSDLILDAGTLKGGAGSTIVDVTTDPVTILREGQVSAVQIRQALA